MYDVEDENPTLREVRVAPGPSPNRRLPTDIQLAVEDGLLAIESLKLSIETQL